MYIIIIGCGKVGYHLTRALLSAGHEAVAIELNARKIATVLDELGSVAVGGDGTEPAVLEEAGVERADVLIAVTGDDEDNLVACQVAKHRFNVPKTIALANNPENDDLFKKLGVDVVVSSSEIILTHVEEELPNHPLIHMLPLPGSVRELVGIHIPSDAAVVGKPLEEVPLPFGTMISLLVGTDGEPRLPINGIAFQADDEVIFLTTPASEDMLLDIFTRIE
ncbi:MAG: portal protein [SAR202 cluster bacterium Io17-Chloro-G3]|nr:MAG: portal protein [SAR202 cluster bacterium Io17-Chloro-G3]